MCEALLRFGDITGQSLPILRVWGVARFGGDLRETVREPVEATAGSTNRQRPSEHLQSMLSGLQGIDDSV